MTSGTSRPPGAARADLAARATRLAAAGAVGASVVHELRNALAVVSSSLFLAKRDRKDEDKLLRHLEKANDEVIRAQAVVAVVLGLAWGEMLAHKPTPTTSKSLAEILIKIPLQHLIQITRSHI